MSKRKRRVKVWVIVSKPIGLATIGKQCPVFWSKHCAEDTRLMYRPGKSTAVVPCVIEYVPPFPPPTPPVRRPRGSK